MTDRERLVERIQISVPPSASHWAGVIADELLADGWMRPPVKVGQTVYIIHQEEVISGTVRLIRPFISENKIIYKGNVECMINIFSDSIKEPYEFYVVFENPCGIERIAYLSREEAVKALRGGESDA